MNKFILALMPLFFSTTTFAKGQICPDLNGVYRLVDRAYTETKHEANLLRKGVLWAQRKSVVPEISTVESTHLTFLGEPAEIGISNQKGSIFMQFGGSQAELIVDGARRDYSQDPQVKKAYVVARCSSPHVINIFEDGEHRIPNGANGRSLLRDTYESQTFLRQINTGAVHRLVRGSQWDQNGVLTRTYEINEVYELVTDLRGESGRSILSQEAIQGSNMALSGELLMAIVTYSALLKGKKGN